MQHSERKKLGKYPQLVQILTVFSSLDVRSVNLFAPLCMYFYLFLSRYVIRVTFVTESRICRRQFTAKEVFCSLR